MSRFNLIQDFEYGSEQSFCFHLDTCATENKTVNRLFQCLLFGLKRYSFYGLLYDAYFQNVSVLHNN